MQLLVASNNRKKRAELEALLGPLGLEILTPEDVGGVEDVDEDQPTFAGNAAKKARAAALEKELWTLADDSGLEVEALEGAPGVYSARYAGTHGDDGANNAKLLAELDGLPEKRRGARFVCALALSSPSGKIVAELFGETAGRILTEARGQGGFGYDPLFLFTEEGHAATDRVFAELAPDEKSAVSHRGRALRALAELLPKVLPSPPHQPSGNEA
ncbi:MAG: XTP/dITP diphosphohydrolase [Planctomycetota bacterium]|jgi:XTP/dITP diphosphohydrolase